MDVQTTVDSEQMVEMTVCICLYCSRRLCSAFTVFRQVAERETTVEVMERGSMVGTLNESRA